MKISRIQLIKDIKKFNENGKWNNERPEWYNFVYQKVFRGVIPISNHKAVFESVYDLIFSNANIEMLENKTTVVNRVNTIDNFWNKKIEIDEIFS